MNTFFHLTSKDPERKCHIIKPFTSTKLNSVILTNGKVRTDESILKLKHKIININNARHGVLDMCCKNPVNQKYNENILQGFRELFPSVREIKEGGIITHLEVSTEPILDKNKGWKQLSPYHICKLTSAILKPKTGEDNVYKAINLVEDCYTANCDNEDTLTLEGLLREETTPVEYSYYDDLKMYQSIEEGNLDYIKSYLFKYNKINKVLTHDDFGNYILHIATRYYRKNIYELIIAMRPNVRITNSFGDTPLHIACLYGHLEAINTLLKLGAEVNIKNNKGMTPLMMAVQYKDLEPLKNNPLDDVRLSIVAIMIKTLIRAGADINAINHNNENVLHIFIKNGQTNKHLSSITRMLLEYGVDVNIKNLDGKTPLQLTASELDNVNSYSIHSNKPINTRNKQTFKNIKNTNVKNTNKENFQVEVQSDDKMTNREIELKEIQTMIFNQIIRNNSDKYSKYINVSEIPAGAPIEVLNYVCSGDNPDILGIEDKDKCEKMGGIFTKIKKPTTKVKLELLPESDMAIASEEAEELYYLKYPESILERELPDEIKNINQSIKFKNNVGNNLNSDNTKTIKDDTYIDRDSMINIPLKNGELVSSNININSNNNFSNNNNSSNNNSSNNFSSNNFSSNNFSNNINSSNNNSSNINSSNKKNKNKNNTDDEMLLSNIDNEHPEMQNSQAITTSVSEAMNNSSELMINIKSNISKKGFMDNTLLFIKKNIIGIILLLILLISLVSLFTMK